ncbi:MAG: hypothetical protein WC775_01005 [Patescibacteria group bacterium]
MSPEIIKKIAYFFFAVNTLCVMLLFEMVLYRIPFATIFVVILGSVWLTITT